MSTVFVKTYKGSDYDKKEILHYMYVGSSVDDVSLFELIDECISECEKSDAFSFRVCYAIIGMESFYECFGKRDEFVKKLDGCCDVCIFNATIGIGIDRLIKKYSVLSPAKSLVLQAIGAERVEMLCDKFCNDLCGDVGGYITERFSPGYSGISLEMQKLIFGFLDCARNIGVTLCNSMIMSPTKSVTAFVGIKRKGNK